MASITVTPVLLQSDRIKRLDCRCHVEGALELLRRGPRSGLSDILLTGCSCSIKISPGVVAPLETVVGLGGSELLAFRGTGSIVHSQELGNCRLVSAVQTPMIGGQMRKGILLTALLAVFLAACGTEAGEGLDSTSDLTPGSAMGPGVSIEDAIALGSNQPVLVNGFLFVDSDGTVTLASLMAESLPPIPGGAQLSVEGLDPDAYEFAAVGELRWTDQPVQVLGFMDGDTLVVSSTLSG